MRKNVFFAALVVAVLFITAVGMCFGALNAPQTVFSEGETGFKIVLDAGHGGIDGGVTGRSTGVKESDINLAITLMLKDELEEMGFEVVLTRKTEAGLYDAATKGFKKRDMQKRKEIINDAKPSMVVSVHQNFYPSQSSRGAQVFYTKSDERSARLAATMQEKLNALYAAQGAKGRNSATGEYFMLTCYPCPSVIVECGFLSNPKDEVLLASKSWQRKLAETVAEGVVAYFSGSLS